jgi:hypothetical protein
MSFSQTNRMRSKKKDAIDTLNSLPASLTNIQSLLEQIFSIFDGIGKNLIDLAMYNVDPDILDKFDVKFKEYNLKKNELGRSLEQILRISNILKESDALFGSESGSTMDNVVINDLQSALLTINETIGSDITKKLEELKILKDELHAINSEVKQPVEQINESLKLFQKTTDVSFEIFTKSTLESLKNSVEMRAVAENLEERLYDIESKSEELPKKMKNNLKDEIRSVVNEAMVNLDVKFQKVLEEKLKDIKVAFSTDLANLIDAKFNSILEALAVSQTKIMESKQQKEIPSSRDIEEMNVFLKYLYSWPSNKDEIMKKIEEFRDTLLVRRANDAPFRVSATNVFREALSLLTREERVVHENRIREIISSFENLKETIKQSEI